MNTRFLRKRNMSAYGYDPFLYTQVYEPALDLAGVEDIHQKGITLVMAVPTPSVSAALPPNVSAARPLIVSVGPTPIVSAASTPTVSAAGLPTVSAAGLPIVSVAPLSIVSAARPPTVSATRPPTVSATRPPTVSASRPPIVSASRPPIVSAALSPTVWGTPPPIVSAALSPTVQLPSGIYRILPPPTLPRTYRERNTTGRPASTRFAFDLLLRRFLSRIDLEQLAPTLEREQITLDILAEMSHNDLRSVGIAEFGYRHRLLRAAKLIQACMNCETNLVELTDELPGARHYGQSEYATIRNEIQWSVQAHQHQLSNSNYKILKIQKIVNSRLWERYQHRRREVAAEVGSVHERLLFHGSPFIDHIVKNGFDERHAYISGIFGAGIYFAEHCTKSDMFVYKSSCPAHRNIYCNRCDRKLLLCRVILGRALPLIRSVRMSHAPPGHHAVSGGISQGGLCCPEHVVYRGEQAYPEYLITYQVTDDSSSAAEENTE